MSEVCALYMLIPTKAAKNIKNNSKYFDFRFLKTLIIAGNGNMKTKSNF
jgi:hypothetical protein